MPVTMKPLTPIGSPSPLRLLNKGPDYLRRQMEGGGQGRSISAVERLEADKAKYVKSQQVINTKQEPVLVPCTPPPPHRRPLTVPGTLTPRLPPRRSSAPFTTLTCPLTVRDENENDDSRKENRRTSVDVEARNRSNANKVTPPSPRTPRTPPSTDHEGSLLPSPGLSPGLSPGPSPGLQRSKSDLLLRCSVALSDQEHFFDYCGLDLDMVDRLGPENFLGGASDVDTLSLVLRSIGGGGGGSEPSEFSRHSGEAGLFQEEVAEKLTTGVSIIERNARVIKWLYSCKNAAQEGPKESTV
uniref:Family with sequence similarity 110 member D n=1 Tax=Hucho hucho TaxID=62062 RepID=A0A4W5LER8_9TELE